MVPVQGAAGPTGRASPLLVQGHGAEAECGQPALHTGFICPTQTHKLLTALLMEPIRNDPRWGVVDEGGTHTC